MLLGLGVLLVVAAAAEHTAIVTYSYTCEVCGQSWKDESTSIGGLGVWRQQGSHTATDHPPTYHGGGYSRWGGGLQGCGVHRQVSP
jgi:hypothetical protein